MNSGSSRIRAVELTEIVLYEKRLGSMLLFMKARRSQVPTAKRRFPTARECVPAAEPKSCAAPHAESVFSLAVILPLQRS
jgi:hypothetical protein